MNKIKIKNYPDRARPWLAECGTCKVRATRAHSQRNKAFFAWRRAWTEAATWAQTHWNLWHKEVGR